MSDSYHPANFAISQILATGKKTVTKYYERCVVVCVIQC